MDKTYSMLNPTAIGKHFNVSPQKVNLILSELGFMVNDVEGWMVTKLGKENGGKQLQHFQSGKFYVLWPKTILTNKNLVSVFVGTKTDNSQPLHETDSTAFAENFRQKYQGNYRTRDGHFVRSKSEVIIDDWLYTNGLVHSYERKLPITEDVVSDFYIPSGNGRPQSVFIEFWGLENDPKYKERMRQKIEIYRQNDLNLIELFESDIQNIDDVLPRKLLPYKIKFGG